ncbi:MAG: NFYB/HAP3 family transcription factor subunit [Theionarchaea archaeon]|nr:NFYB/HAP3 family transcription factor subunit [Theionarchaea archaeon]MBU7043424.1 NFYB/HAP3 family transcription factor subunit [Theionarchaea archaeon]
MVLSSPPVERLIRRGGAERVSKAAAKELAKFLEEYAVDISKRALEFAYTENRKTVREEDIRKAIKENI